MDNLEDLVALVPDADVVVGDVIARVEGGRQVIGRMAETLTLNEVGEKLVADIRAKLDAEAAADTSTPAGPRRGRRAAPATEGAALTLGVADTQAAVDQVSG